MTERGMGAAVGQDPEIARMVVEWVMEVATIPVITKLTPNVHSVVPTGKAAVEAGSHALSLINTIQSVTGIDLDTFVPNPYVARKICIWWLLRTSSKTDRIEFLATIAQDETTPKEFLYPELAVLVPGRMRWSLCYWVQPWASLYSSDETWLSYCGRSV